LAYLLEGTNTKVICLFLKADSGFDKEEFLCYGSENKIIDVNKENQRNGQKNKNHKTIF